MAGLSRGELLYVRAALAGFIERFAETFGVSMDVMLAIMKGVVAKHEARRRLN